MTPKKTALTSMLVVLSLLLTLVSGCTAPQAENALRRVGFEAQQAIVKATAEAKGLELQKVQITAQLLDLRRIEVQGRAVEKWNGVMPGTHVGCL